MSTVRGMKNEPWNEDWCVLGVCIEDLVADLDLEMWHLSSVLHALTSLWDSHSSNNSGSHRNGIFTPGYVPLAIQSSSQAFEIVSIFWAEMKQSWSIGEHDHPSQHHKTWGKKKKIQEVKGLRQRRDNSFWYPADSSLHCLFQSPVELLYVEFWKYNLSWLSYPSSFWALLSG